MVNHERWAKSTIGIVACLFRVDWCCVKNRSYAISAGMSIEKRIFDAPDDCLKRWLNVRTQALIGLGY